MGQRNIVGNGNAVRPLALRAQGGTVADGVGGKRKADEEVEEVPMAKRVDIGPNAEGDVVSSDCVEEALASSS